jgi:type VI secretion system protein ImpL
VAPGAVAPPPGRGKAYFVERLLKEVLIGESGLASVNRRLEMKKAAVQLGAYAALALVTVVGIIVLSVSYSRNRSYIAEAASDVDTFRKVPPRHPVGAARSPVARLDAMRAVVDSTNRYRDDRPWAMRWGLYQGTSIGNAARDAYLRELDGILLPRFAARLRQRLGEYGREPEKLYVLSQAYLMLGEPKHLDKAHLQYLADLEWKGPTGPHAGGGVGVEAFPEPARVRRHAAADRARSGDGRAGAQHHPAGLGAADHVQPDPGQLCHRCRACVRLDAAGGIGMEKVLKRKSGVSPLGADAQPLQPHGVQGRHRPGHRGARQAVRRGQLGVGRRCARGRQSGQARGGRQRALRADYIAAWDGMLRDIELVPFSTVRQTAEALGILASPTSPLRGC